MKVKFYLVMAIAAFLMSNCSQDEPLVQAKNNTNTLTAFIENASRSSVTDGGVFKWNENDAIAVGNADGGYTKFVYGNETFTAGTSITPKGYAIYPYNEAYGSLPESGLPTIKLADTYAYGSTNAPMLATIEGGSTSLTFKHLAGLMRFRVKNIPSEATSFILTADKVITGEFTPITENSEVSIQAGEGTNNNEVTITFANTEIQNVMDFYVPMPIGKYTSLKVKIGEKELSSASGITNIITRGKLLLMPTMVYDETNGLTLEGGNNVTLNADEVVSLNVDGGENVVVEIADGATATLNLIAPENSTEGLTISDGSAEGTESGEESAGTLHVSTTNASTLKIDAPTLTVNLTSGSYDKVEALTAQQTLIIGEGVTIGELVLKGGNVRIKGEVETIKDENDNEYTLVKTLAELNTAIVDGKNPILGSDIESSEIITIDNSIALNGNGYQLTSTAGRAINIETTGTVTINNLNIVAAERAINIINQASTVKLNNVIATADNNAVMIATSAGAVKLAVKDCDFTGLAVVNVAGEGAQVTITDTQITNVDNTSEENYGAITVWTSAEGASVSVSGGQITVSDDSKKAYVFPADATVTGVDDIGYIVALVGDAGYETLAEAVKEVSAGGTIKLVRNVEASEIITIKKSLTIEGNGKTLTSTAGRAINVETTGIVTINNLNIVAAERAINIINQASTVNLNNVTATADNNAVMIATSAGSVKLAVKDCDFTGLAVVNVAGAGAQVTITDTKIVNVDATDAENYGAITVWTSAEGASVSVSGGQISVSDDSKKAYIFPADATVTGVDDIGYIVALVGDAGYETLAEAVKEVSAGGTIKLVRDITLENYIEIRKTVTIDLNGMKIVHPISSTAEYPDVFEVYDDGKLTIDGDGQIIAENGFCIYATGNSNVTINGGYYFSNVTVVDARKNAKVTINGGEFKVDGTNNPDGDYGQKFTLNLRDKTDNYVSEESEIVVKGGKFYNYNPAASESEPTVTNFVAEGYTSTKQGDYYVVSKNN